MSIKIKPYKIQDLLFSCLRSKIAYEKPINIKNIFKKNGIKHYNILNCDLVKCNFNLQKKIEHIVDNIVDDMHSEPIFYDGRNNQNNKRDSQAYMIWKSNTIYITYEGTNSLYEALDAADIREKKIKDNIIVHNGFAEQFFSIEPYLTNDIINIMNSYPIERIIFTGHSKGGSVAAISSAYFAEKFNNLFITCHMFGSPIIGNIDFVKWFISRLDEYSRIEIEDDIVPLIKYNNSFKHIPNGILLKRDGSVERNYTGKPLNYPNILKKLNNFDNIILTHSCENFIDKLFSLENVKNIYKQNIKINNINDIIIPDINENIKNLSNEKINILNNNKININTQDFHNNI